jgi:hypothetical protein
MRKTFEETMIEILLLEEEDVVRTSEDFDVDEGDFDFS